MPLSTSSTITAQDLGGRKSILQYGDAQRRKARVGYGVLNVRM